MAEQWEWCDLSVFEIDFVEFAGTSKEKINPPLPPFIMIDIGPGVGLLNEKKEYLEKRSHNNHYDKS